MSLRTIEFLDASGHLALEWDPSNPESVDKARSDFETLRQAGYSFFRVVAQQVGGFDPSHGALEVRRVDASEVEPRLEATTMPAPPMDAPHKARRGRPPGSHNKPKVPEQAERVVAARPMRGG